MSCLQGFATVLVLLEPFSLRSRIQNSVLVGERHGKKCDGFDYGNSPSTILKKDVAGKTIIHTTSAGTQGIVNAVYADEIITGSLISIRKRIFICVLNLTYFLL